MRFIFHKFFQTIKFFKHITNSDTNIPSFGTIKNIIKSFPEKNQNL